MGFFFIFAAVKKIFFILCCLASTSFAGNIAEEVLSTYLKGFNPLTDYSCGDVGYSETINSAEKTNITIAKSCEKELTHSKYTIKIVKSYDKIPWKEEYTEGYNKSNMLKTSVYFPESKYANEQIEHTDKVVIINNYLVHYTFEPLPDNNILRFNKEVNANAQVLISPITSKKPGILISVQGKNIARDDFLSILQTLDFGKIEHNILSGE